MAQLIQIYHESGKEGVNQWIQRWRKIWAKEARDRWYAAYLKNKMKEAKRRSDLAKEIHRELQKKTKAGRERAMELLKQFHVFQSGDSHEEWRIKSYEKLRPTPLKFDQERT